jgi:hypothetical protein
MCDHQSLGVIYLPTIPSEYAFMCTIAYLIESIDKKVLEIYNKVALDELIMFFESGLAGICFYRGIERISSKDTNHMQNLNDALILQEVFGCWDLKSQEIFDVELYTRRVIDLLLFIKGNLGNINERAQNNITILVSFLDVLQRHSYKGQLPDSNDDE